MTVLLVFARTNSSRAFKYSAQHFKYSHDALN